MTRQIAATLQHAAEQMLGPTLRILKFSGLTESQLQHVFAVELTKLARTRKRKSAQIIKYYPGLEEVIRRWLSDPQYSELGRPQFLKVKGGAPSFFGLVRSVSDTLNPTAALRALKELRMIRERKGGILQLKREFLPFGAGRNINLELVTLMAVDFLRALEVDLIGGRKPGRALFLRAAHSWNVDSRIASIFNRFAREQSQIFLESIDDWLRHHSTADSRKLKAKNSSRLGLGIYVINEALR